MHLSVRKERMEPKSVCWDKATSAAPLAHIRYAGSVNFGVSGEEESRDA
jgi:hypothetical protein